MAKTDSGDGLILWKLTLRKAETKKLFMKFTVEHTRDLRINGLELDYLRRIDAWAILYFAIGRRQKIQ